MIFWFVDFLGSIAYFFSFILPVHLHHAISHYQRASVERGQVKPSNLTSSSYAPSLEHCENENPGLMGLTMVYSMQYKLFVYFWRPNLKLKALLTALALTNLNYWWLIKCRVKIYCWLLNHVPVAGLGEDINVIIWFTDT